MRSLRATTPAPNQGLRRRPIQTPVSLEVRGIAASRLLPDDEAWEAWRTVILAGGAKEGLLRQAQVVSLLRPLVSSFALPLHGLILLAGPPGVGKTTLGRGLGAPLSSALGTEIMLIEIDNHALVGSGLGSSQKAVDQLFRTTIAEASTGGPTLVLIDEVETLVTSRSTLSFEANPADVHRAVDAALTGLDNVARERPDLLIVATTNFESAIDEAFLSRVDYVFRVPLPDQAGRAAILAATLRAMAQVFVGIGDLLDPVVIDRLATAAEGLDARRLRKSVATACALDDATAADPNHLTEAALMQAIALMGAER